MVRIRVTTGVEERGIYAQGWSGNLREPDVSLSKKTGNRRTGRPSRPGVKLRFLSLDEPETEHEHVEQTRYR